jgi:hypothetical protein
VLEDNVDSVDFARKNDEDSSEVKTYEKEFMKLERTPKACIDDYHASHQLPKLENRP